MTTDQLFDGFFRKLNGSQTLAPISSKAFRRGASGPNVSAVAPAPTSFSFDQIAKEMQYLEEKSICVFCQTRYIRSANIGRHQCRYHPLPGAVGTTTDCCGQSRFSLGCTPCDHSPEATVPRWTPSNSTFRLPVQLQEYYNIPMKNCTPGRDPSFVEVARKAPFVFTPKF